MSTDKTRTQHETEHLQRAGRAQWCRAESLRMSLSLAVCLFAVGLLTADGRPSVAQDVVDVRREYNVKAVLLYGFGRYITWPETSFQNDSSPFVIGVFGDYPFGDALDRVAQKKTIHGRRIVVRRLSSTDHCPECHILFLAASVEEEAETAAIEAARGKHVLVVGETPGFARRGGIINFFIDGNNVRFELNVEIARQEQLSLNAKMHSLGVRVKSQE